MMRMKNKIQLNEFHYSVLVLFFAILSIIGISSLISFISFFGEKHFGWSDEKVKLEDLNCREEIIKPNATLIQICALQGLEHAPTQKS